MMEQVRGVKQGDMVIVCELPSYVVEVTEAVTKCASQKAKIMTITDTAAAPVCSVATLQFYVSALSPTFGSSIIGPLFLAHLLTSILSVELGGGCSKRSRRTTKVPARRKDLSPCIWP